MDLHFLRFIEKLGVKITLGHNFDTKFIVKFCAKNTVTGNIDAAICINIKFDKQKFFSKITVIGDTAAMKYLPTYML